MRYCKRCLYPENHPLHIVFDADGVCSGCRVHEEKDVLDWGERGRMLGQICDAYRSRDGRHYDCIIPVSGARDSHFIVHTMKYVYGMHPLLVTYNKHYNTRRGIRNLAYLRTQMDCDLITFTSNPDLVKKITRVTLRRLGSMYWHCLAGETVFPVQSAVRFKIPLIVWGAHQGLDQVGMFSHTDEVEMTRRYRQEHDLMGCEAEDLVGDGLQEADVRAYFYPHDKEIEAVGVRGIYLGNYIRWDSKTQHETMIRKYGYETASQQRTFDTYNDVDSFHYSGVHDYIKYLKYGYGKVADHASREIRFGRLTREEGIALVKQYQYRQPRDAQLICDWLDMSAEEFFDSIDLHRDPAVWEKGAGGAWRRRDCVENHEHDPGVDDVRLPPAGNCDFRVTASREPAVEDDVYVTVGRGYVDSPPATARAS